MDLKQYCQLTIDRVASDLHMIAGIPPHLRVEGALLPIPNEPVTTPEDINRILKEILSVSYMKAESEKHLFWLLFYYYDNNELPVKNGYLNVFFSIYYMQEKI